MKEILQFFDHKHLPQFLAVIANPIKLVAELMSTTLPDCEETKAGLRKLLEAKDCFVRARLMKDQYGTDTD